MPRHNDPQSDDALDELVCQLLSCGGVVSQLVSHMVQFEAAGRSAPGTAPIPAVAHSLIRSVIDALGRRYSHPDLKMAAAIVEDVTDAICNEIFLVNPDEVAGSRVDDQAGKPRE